tara:strand:+ start:1170 stop:2216 length:1047 start_codon:yes stop_codon:yes gene_type:complete
MKIAIIGGGIFGITAAIILGKNHSVELFERKSDILQAASGSNQYRIHRGYHYPRSEDTVLGILKSEFSFQNMFSESIVSNNEHHYCISKNNSLTSSKQFVNFCNKHGLEFTPSIISCVNQDSISLSLKVKESIYDPEKLKKIAWSMLKENNIKVNLDTEVDNNIFEEFEQIVICTYSNLNLLLKNFPEMQQDYQFELCEKPVVKLPSSFKNKSIVIMDGPFMCIDPLANTDYHLLCNVKHEIHETNIGKYPKFGSQYNSLLDSGIIKNPSITNYQNFIKSSKDFFPEIINAEHIGSMFTVRAVPPRVEKTDARPTIVKRINKKIITVFSGKITTCVESAKHVEEMINL